eukprot:COSAG04_NODE_20288_length_397_cov_0.520134_1_plen_21_part_10
MTRLIVGEDEEILGRQPDMQV